MNCGTKPLDGSEYDIVHEKSDKSTDSDITK